MKLFVWYQLTIAYSFLFLSIFFLLFMVLLLFAFSSAPDSTVELKLELVHTISTAATVFYFYLFNRSWDCPEEGFSDPWLGGIMSIVAYELE